MLSILSDETIETLSAVDARKLDKLLVAACVYWTRREEADPGSVHALHSLAEIAATRAKLGDSHCLRPII